MCDCCGEKLATHLDHCHVTGQFRGFLCNACNAGIGFLGDNINGVGKALKYIKKFQR
jgi:hypothetical protein